MDPITMGMITGGFGLLGNMFTANTSAANTQAQIANQQQLQAETEQFNANQAAIGRDWNAQAIANQQQYETSMSNTAYQRSVADMKAAGLNPAAMFTHGGPESTPSSTVAGSPTASVSTPSAPMPQNVSPMANLGQVVSQAISSAQAVQGMEKQTADIAKAKEDAKSAYYDQYVKSMSLPEAERKAAEQNWINQHPDWVKQKAESEYKGEMFGSAGGAANTVARGAATVKGVIADSVIPWFKDRINDVTGPTGQALWQKARDAAAGVPKYVGQGGSLVDFKDFPNIRKSTLNPDYGDRYN